LGVDYTTLDLILLSLDKGAEAQTIAGDLSIPVEKVEAVQRRIKANEHKRRLPLILRLS